MDKQQLKPCPFCGWHAILRSVGKHQNEVSCMSMGCRGYVDRKALEQGCVGSSENSAIQVWNRRAPQPPSASDERERFEAWAATQADTWLIVGGLTWSPGTNDYASARTNAAWAAWQARAALSPSPGVDAAEQKPERERLVSHSTVVSKPGSKLEVRQLHLTAAGMRAITSQATCIPGAAPSPAASADEWMAEAERLVDALLEDCAHTDRAALLAHLKARP